MKLRIWRELVILIFIFGGLWLMFSNININFHPIEATLTDNHENKIADMLVNNFLNSYECEKDSLVTKSIKTVSDRLLNALDSNGHKYNIYILKEDQVNAFATLGNNIFIFTGLIDFTENPFELAAVLAHEIGHIEKNHVKEFFCTN